MAMFRTRATATTFGPGVAPVAGAAAEVDATTRGESGEAVAPERWCWIWTAILLGAGIALGSWSHDHWAKSVDFSPPQGINVFALFYILAQAIERLQEPFTPFVKGTRTQEAEPPAEGAATSSLNQRQAKAHLERRAVLALSAPTAANTKEAANAKRTVEQISENLKLLLFGTSSLLAMVATGLLKASLLTAVGVSGIAAWIDVTVTGLAIGAGTKPLHDLISNIQESKEEKKDAKASASP